MDSTTIAATRQRTPAEVPVGPSPSEGGAPSLRTWRLRRSILATLAVVVGGLPTVFETSPAVAASGHPTTPPP